MKIYIAWNAKACEGFATVRASDARYAAGGNAETFGVSTVGDAFRTAYRRGVSVIEVEIPELRQQGKESA